jgi:methionyl aminopeptidase
MRLVFMGPPGAGKGTQGELLARHLGIPRLSTGEMLREARANKTELGRRAQAYMDSGGLVPDEVVLGLVAEALDGARSREGFILDGFPRTIAQAEGLSEILEARSTSLDGVIFLEVPEEELVRLLGDRASASAGLPGGDGAGHPVVRGPGRPSAGSGRGRIHRRDTARPSRAAGFVISLKSAAEIEAIGQAGVIVASALDLVAERCLPGVSTAELDRVAEGRIREFPGAVPAFKGLYGFPATLCTSLNNEVVHGIPSADRVLAAGDIISVDVGVRLDGYYADAAVTVPVGDVDLETYRLLSVTRSALDTGIQQARLGNRVGDIGAAVQADVEREGFSVIRELVGHGVGAAPHEEPQVPNYGRAGHGLRLEPGLVIAIEPMVNTGKRHIRTLKDGWTVVTADGSRSAHFEHTVAITEAGPRVLTAAPVTTMVDGER